jgi:energy-coupling factor transporter ATP-binding protein EcfA2
MLLPYVALNYFARFYGADASWKIPLGL